MPLMGYNTCRFEMRTAKKQMQKNASRCFLSVKRRKWLGTLISVQNVFRRLIDAINGMWV